MDVKISHESSISYDELLQQNVSSLKGGKYENPNARFCKIDVFIADDYGDYTKGKLETYYVDTNQARNQIIHRELSLDNKKSKANILLSQIEFLEGKYIADGVCKDIDMFNQEVMELYKEFYISDPVLTENIVLSNETINELEEKIRWAIAVSINTDGKFVMDSGRNLFKEGIYNINTYVSRRTQGFNNELEELKAVTETLVNSNKESKELFGTIDRPSVKHKVR